MLFEKQRHQLAQAIGDNYHDLHDAGAAMLDGARYAHCGMLGNYQERPTLVNRCLLAGAARTEFTVHAGLFVIWAPANAASVITTKLLAPRAINAGQ